MSERFAGVLPMLREASDGLSLRALGAMTGLDHTTLSAHLRALLAEGLVARRERDMNKGTRKDGKFIYEAARGAARSKVRRKQLIDPWRERRT